MNGVVRVFLHERKEVEINFFCIHFISFCFLNGNIVIPDHQSKQQYIVFWQSVKWQFFFCVISVLFQEGCVDFPLCVCLFIYVSIQYMPSERHFIVCTYNGNKNGTSNFFCTCLWLVYTVYDSFYNVCSMHACKIKLLLPIFFGWTTSTKKPIKKDELFWEIFFLHIP